MEETKLKGIDGAFDEIPSNNITILLPEECAPTDHGANRVRTFDTGSVRDDDRNKPLVNHDPAYSRLRYGVHMRNGANKYEKSNWVKGQPNEAVIESLSRHLAMYELGDRSEDHLMAIKFGVNMLAQNEEREGIAWDHYLKRV